MKNTKKIPKFIAIASLQFASRGKWWSFIALNSTIQQMAIAEGSRKGFKDDKTFSVSIAKKIREEENGILIYKPILRVYRGGVVQKVSSESQLAEWEVTYSDINFE